ncbi:MAG: MFS transporter [Patescibacteria group bacterium]|nr:MFS transporter [Patescibacteria group bacterium]MCL5432131.1 MFS transporter [Patescibacteria group bacterium]
MNDIAVLKVLKIEPFRNLWLAQVISQIFLQLLFFSLMIRVYELTGSNAAVAVVVLLVTIPNVIFGALAGVLVDRSQRKVVMFFAHFLRVLAVLAFLISAETLSWLYLLIFLISTITQFFFPAEAATIHEVVKDKKMLLTANSLFSLTFFSSVIIGNVLAGPFLSLLGDKITFFIVALAFLAASAFTARLPGNAIREWLVRHWQGQSLKPSWLNFKTWRRGLIFADLMEGLDYLYKTPVVRKGILIMGVSQVSIGVLGAIAPGFADKILGVGAAGVSLFIMAPAALGMIAGAMLVGQFFHHQSRVAVVRAGLFVAGAVVISYSFVDFLPATLIASTAMLLILGVANAFLDVPTNTLIQENTPEAVRSRVYGVISTVVGMASLFPVILAGAIADVFGVRLVMLLLGLVLTGFAVYNYRRWSQLA